MLIDSALSDSPNNLIFVNNCIYKYNYTMDERALELRINYIYFLPTNTMLVLGSEGMELWKLLE